MSDVSNPWLTTPDPAAPTPPPGPAADLAPRPTGPTAPQRDVPAPARDLRLPVRSRLAAAELWWLGVHGGAGESTLAALVPGWEAADHTWPRQPGDAVARVVLAARSNMRGLQAAQQAATQWAAGLVPFAQVLGLVVVVDAPGRLPRPLRDMTQLVSGGVPHTWTVPWVEAWRLGEPPTVANAPHQVQRMVDDLRTVVMQAHALEESP